MFYNLIVLNNMITVRDASDGLSDLEFNLGARIEAQCSSLYTTQRMAETDDNREFLDNESFKEYVSSLMDSDDVPHSMRSRSSMRFVSTEKIDRGPYSRYTRGF